MLVQQRLVLALVLASTAADGFAFGPAHQPAVHSRALRMSGVPSKAALSRRELFGVALGTAFVGLPLGAQAAPSGISQTQSPIQDRLSPGHWSFSCALHILFVYGAAPPYRSHTGDFLLTDPPLSTGSDSCSVSTVTLKRGRLMIPRQQT